jgi:hypothetical protein
VNEPVSTPRDAPESRRICLEFVPHASLVSSARRFLEDLYGRWLIDPNDAYRVAMTAHELIENLVKYSSDQKSLVEVDVRQEGEQSVVSIRTKNKVLPEQVEELRRTLDRISHAPDPVAVYDELVRTSPERPGSGLGFARIRAEAEMALDYTVDDGEVTIVAESMMPVRGFSCST